jgi:mannose-1-phosphate guanylyltransferase
MHSSRLWAVVLAGGEGRRLAGLTRDALGRPVPKQFARFGGSRSLLRVALDRAAAVAGKDRRVVVVQESHRAWWDPELRDLPASRVLAQPVPSGDPGRPAGGTAVALLAALARVLELEHDPRVLVLPSDHGVGDEAAWLRSLRRADEIVRGSPEDGAVLLAVGPQPDPDFGWVIAGASRLDGTREVRGFVEKPDLPTAQRLASAGGWCSTFVLAGTAQAMLELYRRQVPWLLIRFVRAMADVGVVPALAALPACDLSRDVLQPAARELRLLLAEPCGWTDLGTPQRLQRWLAGRGGAGGRPEPAADPGSAVALPV